jgi:hypothetical protein
MSPKVRGGDGASLTGFEAFQATLKKILSRMDGNLSLNERWHTLGTYLDGYCYDKDIQNLSQKCAEVLASVSKEVGPSSQPSMQLTAVSCVVFDRLVGWVGHRYPPLMAVLQAVRSVIYGGLFIGKQDMDLQDGILDGDLFGKDILPVAMSVYSEDTYFDELKYQEGIKSANGPPSVAETKFKEQEQRLEYYKKMYVKTLFTAWRSSTVKEKKIESEFAALREQLADLTSYHETRSNELRDKIAKLELENAALIAQVRHLQSKTISEPPSPIQAFTPEFCAADTAVSPIMVRESFKDPFRADQPHTAPAAIPAGPLVGVSRVAGPLEVAKSVDRIHNGHRLAKEDT